MASFSDADLVALFCTVKLKTLDINTDITIVYFYAGLFSTKKNEMFWKKHTLTSLPYNRIIIIRKF